MNRTRPTVSLVAERAVRYLQPRKKPIGSVELVREVLATASPDEATATRVLEAAFGGDPRLQYDGGKGWNVVPRAVPANAAKTSKETPPEGDLALILLRGEPRGRGTPYRLLEVSVLRFHAGEVVAACGGKTTHRSRGPRLRRAILKALDDAVPVVHDPPGALAALERWLGEKLPAPVSLRRLGQERLGLKASDELGTLAAGLGLRWRESADPLERADLMANCVRSLCRPDERPEDLRAGSGSGTQPIDWKRYAFDREFLREIPHTPGTYRFYDAEGVLLYVGKSRDLNRRIGSYFRGSGPRRQKRVQSLLDTMRSIEYEALGSDLEAMLREAEEIRRDAPSANVQRTIRERPGRAARLPSILILEPADPPAVLRAFLVRRGRLLGRVTIGPRGGGLNRISRLLDDHFFSAPAGPTPVSGPDLDVELVLRWLAANRDRVVAFDPTDLRTTDEVVDRLRWFLGRGSPFAPDGSPIHTR